MIFRAIPHFPSADSSPDSFAILPLAHLSPKIHPSCLSLLSLFAFYLRSIASSLRDLDFCQRDSGDFVCTCLKYPTPPISWFRLPATAFQVDGTHTASIFRSTCFAKLQSSGASEDSDHLLLLTNSSNLSYPRLGCPVLYLTTTLSPTYTPKLCQFYYVDLLVGLCPKSNWLIDLHISSVLLAHTRSCWEQIRPLTHCQHQHGPTAQQ